MSFNVIRCDFTIDSHLTQTVFVIMPTAESKENECNVLSPGVGRLPQDAPFSISFPCHTGINRLFSSQIMTV